MNEISRNKSWNDNHIT